MSFDELGLSPETLQAVTDAGYSEPTPIQRQAIPYVLMGRDLVGVAQTGTGKTAGFTLPLIDILADGQAKARMPRALILEPTRELADQVKSSFEKYGKYHKLTTALLIGGMSFGDQDKLLDRGVDVLIATPGRLLDHFERGRVMLSGVKILVIDEADRMMDMGFIPDVERIVKLMPPLRQSLFFSATMSPEMRRLSNSFLSNPKEVSVAPPASPAETVKQTCIKVGASDKRAALRHLLRLEDVKNAIIFCNRKKDVDILAKSLKKHGFDAAPIHGDLSQAVRMETLDSFKTGKLTLLVASDVAARGLDIQGLSHVFNFDVPMNAEDYVHRIGRTGRAGKSGRAYMLATPGDDKFMSGIRSLIKKEIPMELLEDFDASADGHDEEAMHGERKPRGRSRRDEAPAPRRRTASKKAEAEAEADTGEAAAAAAPEQGASDSDSTEAPKPKARSRRGRAGKGRAAAEKAAAGSTEATARPEKVPSDKADEAPRVEAAGDGAATKRQPDEAQAAKAHREDKAHRDEKSHRDETAADEDRSGGRDRRPAKDQQLSGTPQHRKNEPPARGRRNESRRRGGNGRPAGERGNDGRQHDGGAVVGMGDHVPAFMMRPARREQG